MPYLPRLYSDEETRAWVTHVLLPRCPTWVVARFPTEEIVGFASLYGRTLEHLYVRPDVRGRGIGTVLLKEVQRASPNQLFLRVFQRNEVVRAFYERHGFRQIDTDDGGRNEENEPDMTYQWVPPET